MYKRQVHGTVLAGKGRDAFLRQELEGTVLVLPHRPLQKARLGIVFKRLYGGDEQEYEADVERELPETCLLYTSRCV